MNVNFIYKTVFRESKNSFTHLVAGDNLISNSTMIKFSKVITLFVAMMAAMPAFTAGKEDIVQTIQVPTAAGGIGAGVSTRRRVFSTSNIHR